MNKPPDELRGNWSAELGGAETWRDLGKHDSWWEAGMALIEDEQCWVDLEKNPDEALPDNTEIDVGTMRRPREPETLIDADDVIDVIIDCGHDDYLLEIAEDYLQHVPMDAHESLTEMLRSTFARWLDRHGFRPTWFIVDKRWTVTAGEIRAKAKEMNEKANVE